MINFTNYEVKAYLEDMIQMECATKVETKLFDQMMNDEYINPTYLQYVKEKMNRLYSQKF